MHRLQKVLTTTVTGLTVASAQVLWAAHRRDLPALPHQDPSGHFGSVTSPPLRIVVLGDSSVTAPGVDPLDDAWPRRLARRLAHDYRVEVVSLAAGGSKACDVLTHQVDAAISTGADIALVSVGANDALRGTPVGRFERDVRAIVERLSVSIPGVGFSGIGDLSAMPRLPALARGYARVRCRALDRAIARAVATTPGVVKSRTWGPQWQVFATAEPSEMFTSDLFHASGTGHGIFAVAFDAMTDELLRRTRSEEPQNFSHPESDVAP